MKNSLISPQKIQHMLEIIYKYTGKENNNKVSFSFSLIDFTHNGTKHTNLGTYEGYPISTTKEKRKFWKSGDLFFNIVSS